MSSVHGSSRRRRTALVAGLAVVIGVATPVLARAEQVTVDYFGSVDFSQLRTWSWGEGAPARRHEFEQLIRSEVERRLSGKGYQRIEGESADFRVVSRVLTTPPLGVLRIEVVVDGGLAFLGVASGLDQGKVSKNEKLVRRLIKQMFKGFPKGAEQGR